MSSSVRESSFVFTQTNYRKLHRTVQQKWNKRYFQFQIYKFPFIFYFHFLCHIKMKCWSFDPQLTTWNLNRNYCSFIMLKKYFRIKNTRRQKLMTLLINQVLFFLEIRKDASFTEISIILTTFTKAQLLYCSFIVEICVRQR